MSSQIAHRREFSPEFGRKVMVSKTSLALGEDLSFDEWVNLGEQLTEVGDSMSWWIADWLRGGERIYGKSYKEAAALSGLEVGTLWNYVSVANAFAESSRRREDVKFGHHAVVSAMPAEAADTWLALAAENDWSVRDLRAAIGEEVLKTLGSATTVTLERLTITVPEDRAERWKLAADHAGVSVQDWCANVLDAAAESEASRT